MGAGITVSIVRSPVGMEDWLEDAVQIIIRETEAGENHSSITEIVNELQPKHFTPFLVGPHTSDSNLIWPDEICAEAVFQRLPGLQERLAPSGKGGAHPSLLNYRRGVFVPKSPQSSKLTRPCG